jgi:transcriptional accessory protein Tex/SPT6
VGDVVKTWVLSIDRERRRIGLSLISPEAAAARSSGQAAKPGTGPATDRRQSASPERQDRPVPTAGQPLSGFDQLKQVWNSRPDR